MWPFRARKRRRATHPLSRALILISSLLIECNAGGRWTPFRSLGSTIVGTVFGRSMKQVNTWKHCDRRLEAGLNASPRCFRPISLWIPIVSKCVTMRIFVCFWLLIPFWALGRLRFCLCALYWKFICKCAYLLERFWSFLSDTRAIAKIDPNGLTITWSVSSFRSFPFGFCGKRPHCNAYRNLNDIVLNGDKRIMMLFLLMQTSIYARNSHVI